MEVVEYTREDKVIEGNDLAISIYLISWLTVGLLYSFTSNPDIKNILDFYVRLDAIAIIFIVLYLFYSRRRHTDSDREWLDMDSYEGIDFFEALVVVFVLIGFLLLIGLIIPKNIYFGSLSGTFIDEYNFGTYLLLMLTRNIVVEEFVFRGAIIFVVIVLFDKMSSVPKWLGKFTAILISGLSFGLYHMFVYGKNLGPLIYLSFLGFFCAFLTLRYGLWAGILLHEINNLIAAFWGIFIFSGSYEAFFADTVLNIGLIFQAIIYLFLFIVRVLLVKKFDSGYIFGIFVITLIGAFIFGFYTNGLIRSEDVGGLYFQHFHIILFAPLVYFLFKKTELENEALLAITMGFIFGLFISDMADILNQTPKDIWYSGFYALISLQLLVSIKIINESKKIKEFREM